jgi:hypothetical protein
LPIPGSKTTHRRLQIGLIALLVTVIGLALWVTLDDHFYIYTAEVVGTHRLSREDVFRASDLPGLHILWARPAKAAANIERALRGVQSAEVACWLPARCTITVVEREPRVMWEDGAAVWWIDADGTILPAQGLLPESWMVRGPLPRDEDSQLDERARLALAELSSLGLDLSDPLIYEPGRGFAFTDERGWRVVVGDGPGVASRMRVLEAVASDLEARQVTPRFVDVRFPEAPYYSLVIDW